jgi:hypothetical protein
LAHALLDPLLLPSLHDRVRAHEKLHILRGPLGRILSDL